MSRRGAIRAVASNGGRVLATEHEIASDDAWKDGPSNIKGLVVRIAFAVMLECREGEAVCITFGVSAEDQVAEFSGELELSVMMEEPCTF